MTLSGPQDPDPHDPPNDCSSGWRSDRSAGADPFCVVGAGAIGCAIAALLANGGHAVSMIARGARLDAIQRHGLMLHDRTGTLRARLPASDRPDFGIQGTIFLAVKSQALADAAALIRPMIGPATVIVPTVNGIPWWYFKRAPGPFGDTRIRAVDPDGRLDALLPAEAIIGAVVYMAAETEPDGAVRASMDHRLILGELDGRATPRLAALAAALATSDIDAETTPAIRDALWTKLTLNLATNPLSVVSEATLARQAGDGRLRAIVERIIEETAAVARAHGARITLDKAALLARVGAAGDFATSMLQDYRRKRPLETAAIGDAVLELAEKVGLAMPVTQTVLDLARYRSTPTGTDVSGTDISGAAA